MRMLSTISPNRQMDYMFGDFDKIVDGILRTNADGSSAFQPRCDVSETKEYYLASFDMPGVKKEDIKIEIEASQLIISGERKKDTTNPETVTSLRHERQYGKFERTFNLPTTVNIEKIEARYENGVLEIAIPKVELAKGRTIEIR